MRAVIMRDQLAGTDAMQMPTWHKPNALALGLIFVVVVLLALIALPPLMSIRTDALRTRNDDVQRFTDALTRAENDLQQMQAAVRGYLVTQDSAFVEQYRTVQASLPANLEDLTRFGPLVEAALEPQVTELLSVAERWQREGGDRQLDLAEQGRVQEAVVELAAGESQVLFDSFRTRVDDMRARVQETQRDIAVQLSQARMLQIILTVGLSMLGLFALGFVIIGFRRTLALTTERERLVAQVRTQLAVTEQRNRQLTVFNAVASASTITIQYEQRAQNVLEAVVHTLDVLAGAVWLVSDPASIPSLAARYRAPIDPGGALNGRTPLSPNHSAFVAEHDQQFLARTITAAAPTMLNEDGSGSVSALLATLVADKRTQAQSGAIIPLQGRSRPIGALVLAARDPAHFDELGRPFLATLATEIGLALENVLLYAAAQRDRQRLQAVFAHSPEGLVVVELPEKRIVLSNQTATTLLGELPVGSSLAPHPLAGRVFLPGGHLCPEEELPLVQTLADGIERRHVELTVEQPDGQRTPMLVTSVPLCDEAGVLRGAVAVFQDLRQLREVERLKSDFVALVSHELRTPLTTIKGCTEHLLRGVGESDPARVREYLQIIAEQGERRHGLVDTLLSLSQVEAGALRLRRDLVALPSIIQGMLRQVREQAGDLRVQADLPGTLPPVSADARRIEQVISNLIENARKFSPPEGVITITAAAAAGEVIIGVRDQGPGIPPAERERVFERFYQVAQADTRQVGGSGLGLAICKALVEAHGGRIWIEDAPGGGTQVQFSLPALPAEELPEPTGHPRTLTRQGVGPTRVLVVDDDPALRRMLDQTLRDGGYRVQVAAEPQAALEAVTQQPPDLVLLDVMLPGTDGFALCKQLREWTAMPIIMLTARASEQDIVRGLQLGADDYVTKPFHTSELLARMEAVLRRVQPIIAPGEVSLIQTGDLAIDLAQRRVTLAGETIALTPTEYSLLSYLARHLGQVLTREQILHEVWGEVYRDESQYLWVHIAHLRQKIEADSKHPRYILTERGVGYRLARI